MYETNRLAAELELLRSAFSELGTREADGRTWIRLPEYEVPAGWSASTVEVVFAFPAEVGQPPYAFFVRPGLSLPGGNQPANYTPIASTPWGDDFGQFSWAPLEQWMPRTDVHAGANMLNFAMSFKSRLAETS